MRPFPTGSNAVYLLTFATDEYILKNSCTSMSLRITTVPHLPMRLTTFFKCLKKSSFVITYLNCVSLTIHCPLQVCLLLHFRKYLARKILLTTAAVAFQYAEHVVMNVLCSRVVKTLACRELVCLLFRSFFYAQHHIHYSCT